MNSLCLKVVQMVYGNIDGYLSPLKNHLIGFFPLPALKYDTIWENDRNEFLKSQKRKIKCQIKH